MDRRSDEHQNAAHMDSESLAHVRLAISALGWNLVGAIVRGGSGFLVSVILARLLGPEPFGLVALAMLVISLGNLMVESGLSAGLVQKRNISKQDISYVFGLQVFASSLIALLIALSAPFLATLFAEPSVTPVLQVLSLMLIFQAVGQTASALLKRELAFKRIQQAQVSSYLLGYLGLGIPLALTGHGVWSLVSAQLSQSFLYSLQVYLQTRHPVRVTLKGDSTLLKFGINVLGLNLANWVINYADGLIVGRFFGAVSLGLYNRAYVLVYTPLGVVISATQSVLFAATSRLQENLDRTQSVFLGVFSLVSLLFIPMFAAVAVTARGVIEVIYGSRWLEASHLLVPLALAMPLFALMAVEGPILAGLGKPYLELRMQGLTAFIALALLISAAQFSLNLVVWAVFIVYGIRLILMTTTTIKVLDISVSRVARPILCSVLVALIVSAAVWGSGRAMGDLGTGSRLLLQGGVGAIIWTTLILLGNSWLIEPELRASLLRLMARVWFLGGTGDD